LSSIYSYFGQAFVACVPTVPTAQILAAVFIGLNNFFSGLIVRPQYITGFFSVPYWITPGHFVYEGLVIAAFTGDERQVLANPGSPFYDFLKCDNPDEECYGTIDDYIAVFFWRRISRRSLVVRHHGLCPIFGLGKVPYVLCIKVLQLHWWIVIRSNMSSKKLDVNVKQKCQVLVHFSRASTESSQKHS
jgi:hypothetical protein